MSTLTLTNPQPRADVLDGRLDIKAAAARHVCSPVTVRRRIADGELPAVLVGNKQYVLIEDLDRVFAVVSVVPKAERAAKAYADLEQAARRVATEAKPLTQAQRVRLAELLGGAL